MGDLSREHTWQIAFVLLNLVAFGLAAWTIDSTTTGIVLEGTGLVLAPLLGVAILIIAILGSKLVFGRGAEDDATGPDDGFSPDDENTDRDDGDQEGDTDDGSTSGDDLDPIGDSGQPMPGNAGQPSPTTGGSASSASSTTDGDFPVEGYGTDDTRGETPGDPQPTAPNDRAAESRLANAHDGDDAGADEQTADAPLDTTAPDTVASEPVETDAASASTVADAEEADAGSMDSADNDTVDPDTTDSEQPETDADAAIGTDDGKLDPDLFNGQPDDPATGGGADQNGGNELEAADSDGQLDDHSVRYHHNRDPY